MITLLVMLLTLLFVLKDEHNINRERQKNQDKARADVARFNSTMQKLKELQEKDYTKL